MGGICSCCPCCKSKQEIHPSPSKPSTNLQPSEKYKSTNRSQPVSSSSPFVKSGLSKENPRDLIKGYENEPLVSLEEALAPFDGKIDHLSDYIKEAKTKCHYPSEHNLTRDESAAIYIYTKKWKNRCLYDHLQAAWESKDKSQMKPWFKYLRLYKAAYDKLPDATGEIWQGKPFDPRLEKELNSESTPLYTTMDIFSPSKASIEQSLNRTNVNKKILIGFHGVGAKQADDYTADNQNGILVFHGTKLGVFNKEAENGNGSVTYHLKESARKPEPTKKQVTQSNVAVQYDRNHNMTPNDDTTNVLLSIEKHYLCPNIPYRYSIFMKF